MSAPILVNVCPTCGAEEALSSVIFRVIDDVEVRGLMEELLGKSFPLGGTLMRYVTLFKPPKHALNWARVRKVVMELAPDLGRQSIERAGRVIVLSEALWLRAFASVFDAVERGTLKTPLAHSGYLYGALLNMAEQAEAKAEQQRDEGRRHGAGRIDTVTYRGQTLPINEALNAAYGGKDVALAKIDADSRQAAPMPADVRARIDALRGKKGGEQ